MNTLIRYFFGTAAAFAVATIISGCDYEQLHTQDFYSVKLVPQGGGNLSVVLEKGKSCLKNKHEGCMLFPRGKKGVIRFALRGSTNESKVCGDPGVNQVITRIELTDQEKLGSEETKGEFAGGLDAWIKQYAFSGVELGTGIVYEETDVTKAETQVWLLNLNNHPGPAIKSFWYRVTAEGCPGTPTDGDSWTSDPRVDNEGGI